MFEIEKKQLITNGLYGEKCLEQERVSICLMLV